MPPWPAPAARRPGTARVLRRGWRSWIDLLPARADSLGLARLRFRGLRVHLVADPALAAHVLEDGTCGFPKHPAMRHALAPLVGGSLFVAEGEEWAEQRAMMAPRI